MDSEARRIARFVAEVWSVDADDFIGPGKSKSLAEARAVLCLAFRKAFGWSWTRIGRELRRDHTTMLRAAKAVERRNAACELHRARYERVMGGVG